MRRLLILGASILLVVVVVLVIPQLILPGIAAQRLRDQLARSGTVQKVEVHAFPAIQLLWHHADRVVVRMGRYRSSTGKLSSTLNQLGDAGSVDASAGRLTAGALTLRSAMLSKRGNQLIGRATVTE